MVFRELASHTNSDSGSRSDNNSDGKSGAAQAKDKKHKGHSQRHGNFLSHSFFSLLCLCNVVYLVNYFLLPCL